MEAAAAGTYVHLLRRTRRPIYPPPGAAQGPFRSSSGEPSPAPGLSPEPRARAGPVR